MREKMKNDARAPKQEDPCTLGRGTTSIHDNQCRLGGSAWIHDDQRDLVRSAFGGNIMRTNIRFK
jgi:hypothetical protein